MKAESIVQQAIRLQIKALGFDSVSVPNGGHLAGGAAARARQVAAMKRDGMRVGFADLIVLGSNGRVGFIEVKREGTYQSKVQKECQQWLADLGHNYAVARSAQDVQDIFKAWSWI